MSNRGVSRPMALGKAKHSKEHSGHGDDDRKKMLEAHHEHTLWIYWTLPLLGVWLLLAPVSFGYLDESHWVDPSGGRGPWFYDAPSAELRSLRAWLMTVSDLCSGALLLFFGWRSLKPNRPISLWICCFVGIWLTFAPVLFWAPTPASYANGSMVGMLVMALTVLIPGMPNMPMFMQHGPATPPGWSYNPSSWPQRWVMILLGFLGYAVSRYLAMYQLGYIEAVWDPFFGFEAGTQRAIDSKMSHSLPISDAGLGTISYTFEFLMGYMGSKARWRTMPWMVAFFGILVIPLGLTHVLLVISQPVIVHAWCTFCLLAALIMLPMIPLEVDEVVAMCQHLKLARQRGDRGGSLWAVFWKGGRADGCQPDERSPRLASLSDRPLPVIASSLWGMSAPWTLVVATAMGLVLMFLPTAFGVAIETRAADVAHLGGALIVTVSVISMGEVVRSGRYLNVLLGAAVAACAWVFSVSLPLAAFSCILGLLVIVCAFPRGVVRERYGAWDHAIR